MLQLKKYFQQKISAAPLAVFRMGLGIMLLGSIIRFWSKGWIEDLYIQPQYFFSFYGFEYIRPLGNYTYFLFLVCGLCALFVALGLLYRAAVIGLSLSFTYIELMDKSTYLNHYYFISLVCFLMIFLPAHVCFSIDAYRNRQLAARYIPQWCVDALKLMITVLYLYAGLAKVNSDWLLHAQPLKIWLPARNDMPIIGHLFNKGWIPYAFSWFGCLYDLSIPFLLWGKATRWLAYTAVIVFHVLTALMFPIGMFPHIMIVAALLFFSPHFHEAIIGRISRWLKISSDLTLGNKKFYEAPSFILPVFAVFFIGQLVFPFRYLLYPDELFWTEQGYRFSWRVMLMEKAGYAQFTIKDASGKQMVVNNHDFLSPLQEKMMSTQPDMLLQYAHLLRDYYTLHGFESPQVYVDSYVSLNGRLGKPLVSPATDLAREQDSFQPKLWILPFNDTIKGF
ncbi:HTTM domain-containing protein [Emticicia sp. TH156]|uniref:HTTM domain-containing protein n=1 Tax=Emticicia sp. TH156 TaxID=2067454 RepID=UPI000C76694C|nr:HTTM domain-containing protein [Emticicia sp. TH156]